MLVKVTIIMVMVIMIIIVVTMLVREIAVIMLVGVAVMAMHRLHTGCGGFLHRDDGEGFYVAAAAGVTHGKN
jgi:hypothetical protein